MDKSLQTGKPISSGYLNDHWLKSRRQAELIEGFEALVI
jgi:hypothetical protein